ncbi:MAG TPA: ATP-binding protein [Sandaracinaceae bacterium LLY-WYZ-13_1]|nr:ATP-binding protein [Sandaracinaceae bacterium LLY-WYZ-13_1]
MNDTDGAGRADAAQLRAHLSTLAGLMTLPSAWQTLDVARICRDVADVIAEGVHASSVCVDLTDERFAVCVTHPEESAREVSSLRSLTEASRRAGVVASPDGLRAMRVDMAPLSGSVCVGARRPGFPTEHERWVIRAAVDQATLSIQSVAEREARRELEEAARRKDEFLAMLAHELRNPLAAVVSAAELLEDGVDEPGESERYAKVIARQGRHLARLVDDLLDVARLARGLISIDREPLDLRELLRRSVAAHEAAARAGGHTLELRVPEAPVVVDGDRVRLAQVVTNLLGNAIKYTPERGGTIEVTLEVTEGAATSAGRAPSERRGSAPPEGATGDPPSARERAVLRVRDPGLGMDEEELERVFELFHQGPRDLSRTGGGLGIGLTIARDIVRLHGGEVRARSEGPGRGTTLEVELPVVDAPPVERGSSLTLPVVVRRGMQLLVVDDNEDAAEMLARMIERLGHVPRTAFSGVDALELVRHERPDVVLLDLGMPDMDGFELAEALQRREPSMPLVAVTGYGQQRDRARTTEAGFFAHLVKPVRGVDLEGVLSELAAAARREG